jgi:hypothetical protein
MAERRLYIVNLERGVSRKRFFLEGQDTDEARSQLRALMNTMPDLASSSEDWLGFLKKARHQFAQAGFLRVAH